jgi:hypothetical protein
MSVRLLRSSGVADPVELGLFSVIWPRCRIVEVPPDFAVIVIVTNHVRLVWQVCGDKGHLRRFAR